MQSKTKNLSRQYTYQVHRLTDKLNIDGDWEKRQWQPVRDLSVGHFMGSRPRHFPEVRVRLQYDLQAIYVIFKVVDRYVRAIAQNYQDPVFHDSCVEFFFTPAADINCGYFNLEINCGGTALFHFQEKANTAVKQVSESHFRQMTIAHSMPKIVSPEVTEAVVWTLEYRLPFDILANYVTKPAAKAGDRWRANFFKCADHSSHPHWLTWAPVDFPTPRFHLPQYFGTLLFL